MVVVVLQTIPRPGKATTKEDLDAWQNLPHMGSLR
jgi:hypothetical protein